MSTHPATVPSQLVSVFLAVRHHGLRTALWGLLETEPAVEPLAAVPEAGDLLPLLRRVAPMVVVVDESALGDGGIARLPELVAAAPQTAFVVVGMYDEPAYLTRAREAGATDYVCLDEAERLGPAVLAASEHSGLCVGM